MVGPHTGHRCMQLELAAGLGRGSVPSAASSALGGAGAGSSAPPSEGASPLGSSYSDLSDAPAPRPLLQQALSQLEVRQDVKWLTSAVLVCPSPASRLQPCDRLSSGTDMPQGAVHAPCRARSAKRSPPRRRTLHLSQAQVSTLVNAYTLMSNAADSAQPLMCTETVPNFSQDC